MVAATWQRDSAGLALSSCVACWLCSRPRCCLSLAGCGSFGRSPSTNSEGGFFGWHFYAPFDTSEVKTVAVFFKTNSFRRDVEKQLTEAVDQGDHAENALQGGR